MANPPLVSVVTPFFNTGEYLAQCIESILAQDYPNWNYVLVDNQSTDGSSEIAAKFAEKYPQKIRVVRTASFLTQVQNYNFALTQISAESKYCKMCQADDWLFPDCLSKMVNVAEVNSATGIVGAYELAGDDVDLDGLPFPSTSISGRDVCRFYFLKKRYVFGTPTSLMMRSDLVRSRVPFFEEKYAPFEDAHVCFDLLRACDFGFVHQVLTYSRRDNDSILSKIRPFGFLFFSRFALVVAHGKDFLSGPEYEDCFQDAERQYFSFLARSALRGTKKGFWDFHRKGLASLGYDLNGRTMARWVGAELLNYLGNPKRTIEATTAKWTRKQPPAVPGTGLES